jgi:hypothetical protein
MSLLGGLIDWQTLSAACGLEAVLTDISNFLNW